MRRALRAAAAAAVAVIGCLVLFFSAGSGSTAIGTRQESWLSVGQPWPWYESRIEQEVKPNGGFASAGNAGVIMQSPAWLLLVGAGAGVIAFRRLRPVPSAPVGLA
jgi:hypothetical protein